MSFLFGSVGCAPPAHGGRDFKQNGIPGEEARRMLALLDSFWRENHKKQVVWQGDQRSTSHVRPAGDVVLLRGSRTGQPGKNTFWFGSLLLWIGYKCLPRRDAASNWHDMCVFIQSAIPERGFEQSTMVPQV